MPTPDTWSAYYRRAAADEAALGNVSVARVLLRDARRADAQANLISYKPHIEANAR